MNPSADIEKLITDFRDGHSSALDRIRTRAQQLTKACRQIERSWSGSYAGWHGQMYYGDFSIPEIDNRFNGEWGAINGIPDGWEERQTEEVVQKIDELVGSEFSCEVFEGETGQLKKDIEDLRDEVVYKLSGATFLGESDKGRKLSKAFEALDCGNTKNKYIHSNLPGTIMTRDSEALRQGTCIPVWLYYSGVAAEAEHLCSMADKVLKIGGRLVEYFEEQHLSDSSHPSSGITERLATLHPKIAEKCGELYEKAVYAEAAEKGFKIVRDRLRELTGFETGSEAFGKSGLHIKGAAAPNVDDDFNAAVKFLTMSIDRFRNEKSHTSDGKIDDPIRAYEYLRLSSLAMYLLDGAEITS